MYSLQKTFYLFITLSWMGVGHAQEVESPGKTRFVWPAQYFRLDNLSAEEQEKQVEDLRKFLVQELALEAADVDKKKVIITTTKERTVHRRRDKSLLEGATTSYSISNGKSVNGDTESTVEIVSSGALKGNLSRIATLTEKAEKTTVDVPKEDIEKKKNDDLLKQLKVNSLDNGIYLEGDPTNVDRAAWLMATRIDLPLPQIRMEVVSIQVNADASDFSGTEDRLNTMELGLRYTRQCSLRFQDILTDYFQRRDHLIIAKLQPLLEKGGFNCSPHRHLSLLDHIVFLGASDRDTLLRGLSGPGSPRSTDALPLKRKWQSYLASESAKLRGQLEDERLSCKEREAIEHLLRLSLAFEARATSNRWMENLSRFYWVPEPPASKDEDGIPGLRKFTPGQRTLEAFLEARYPTDPSGKRRWDAQKLTAISQATDSDLRSAAEAYSQDIEYLMTNPYWQWISEIASETDQLNLLGKQEIWVQSGGEAISSVSAINHRPFIAAVKESEDGPPVYPGKPKVALDLLLDISKSKDIAEIYAGLQDTLFKPTDLTYTTLSPGMNLTITPAMATGGGETHLKIDLQYTAATDEEISGQEKLAAEKGLYPVSLLKTNHLVTEATIPSFELFELSTQWLQTTREGGPTWSVPVLRYIPLVGKYLFQGPDRPRTRNQGVVIFCQATLIPRSIDLVRKEDKNVQ